MHRSALTLCSFASLALPACVGNPLVVGIGDESAESGGGSGDDDDGASVSDSGAGPGGSEGGSDGGGPDDTGPAPACPVPDTFGAITIGATLTPAQYHATALDLTGVSVSTHDFIGIETGRAGPFSLGVGIGPHTDAVAQEIAAAVDLDARLPCASSITDATAQQQCFDDFTPAFARMAWRRPVAEADLAAQMAIFDVAGAFDVRMRAVIASVLADERFVAIATTGTPSPEDPTLVELDAHSLATRLAMFLWSSGPDDELLAAADSGELLDPAVLHGQAERLLADPRAARFVDDFHTDWLALSGLPQATKDAAVFPEFNDELGEDMLASTLAFVRSIVIDGSGRLEDLFMSPTSYANANVAAVLESDIVGPVPAGAAFEPVQLDPARRGGLLTEPSFATEHSHYDSVGFSWRGLVIRRNLLCDTPLPPPPDVDMGMDTVELPEGLTKKEFWSQFFEQPQCMICHETFDPFGFALDNYDAMGRWTSQIDGLPIDTSGATPDFTFTDRVDLVDQLLASDDFNACVVRQYVQYALDREPDEADACTLEELQQRLEDSDGDVRALALAIVDSDAFRVVRTP